MAKTTVTTIQEKRIYNFASIQFHSWDAHLKMQSNSGLFFIYCRLSKTVDNKQIVQIKFSADDWIQTMDLWYCKRLLFQLSHNHFSQILVQEILTPVISRFWDKIPLATPTYWKKLLKWMPKEAGYCQKLGYNRFSPCLH